MRADARVAAARSELAVLRREHEARVATAAARARVVSPLTQTAAPQTLTSALRHSEEAAARGAEALALQEKLARLQTELAQSYKARARPRTRTRKTTHRVLTPLTLFLRSLRRAGVRGGQPGHGGGARRGCGA
jgi:hypothetical protein